MQSNLIEELRKVNIITSAGKTNKRVRFILQNQPELLAWVVNSTAFLPETANLPERIFCIRNNITTQPLCHSCNQPVRYNYDAGKYNQYCSFACLHNSDKVKEKKRQTCQKHYGVDNPSQSLKVQKKKEQTSLLHFGTLHPQQNVDLLAQRKQTMLERYGKFPLQRHIPDDILNKIDSKEWLEEQQHERKKTLHEISKDLNLPILLIWKRFQKFNIPVHNHFSSYAQNEILCFLKTQIDEKIIFNTRDIISPYELDFYIPTYNVAIEYDGIVWHSEIRNTPRMYHLTKTNKCQEKGIFLIHIFENEWVLKQDIVKSRLKSILGKNKTIAARKCKVVELDFKTTNSFFNNNHIQGHQRSSIYLGLQYNTELVAAIAFSRARYNRQVEWELTRYCNLLNVNIIGGASKLLQYFIRNYTPISIVSYSDKRWNTGNMYRKLGFEYRGASTPNYFYFKNSNALELHSRLKFQKHRLPQLLENFDPDLTEWENMVNNGYDRIWDCGNDVWIWTK